MPGGTKYPGRPSENANLHQVTAVPPYRRAMTRNPDQIGEMSDDEKTRIYNVLRTIGHEHTEWMPAQYFDVWLVEHRMAAERSATRRLTHATWALAVTTLVLVLATIALVIVTAHHG
jgi:hypothetical protein